MRIMVIAIALSALVGALGAGHAAPGQIQPLVSHSAQ